MLKQSLIYLFLSIIVILFAKYAQLIILYIDLFYVTVNTKLAQVFSPTHTGVMIRQILTLTLIPVIVASIPALIYRLIKKKAMPYFFEITWMIWLVIVIGKILIH